MNNPSLPGSISGSVQVYRALLVVYPKKYREHYEVPMLQVFRDSACDAHRRHGMPGLVDLWLHSFADLLITALLERISEGSQFMFSPKLILLGGVASICAGLFWIPAGFPDTGGLGLVLGFLLGLGGLAGLYSRQAAQGGRLGLAGFVLGIIGIALPLSAVFWATGKIQTESQLVDQASTLLVFPLGMLILGFGLALIGITSLRAKTPRLAAGLPLILALLNVLVGIVFTLAFYLPLSHGLNPWNPWNYPVYRLFPAVCAALGLGWLGLGISLTMEGYGQVIQPPPASA